MADGVLSPPACIWSSREFLGLVWFPRSSVFEDILLNGLILQHDATIYKCVDVATFLATLGCLRPKVRHMRSTLILQVLFFVSIIILSF